MQKLHLVAAAILVCGIGTADAQTTTSETTTTVMPGAPAPVVVPPPVGTLSTSRTRKVVRPDGSSYEKHTTTYRDTSGSASDSVTRVTPAPVMAPQSTTTTTTRTITQRP